MTLWKNEILTLRNVASLDLSYSRERRDVGSQRHDWKLQLLELHNVGNFNSREHCDVGPNVTTFPYFYEQERSYSHIRKPEEPKLCSLIFASALANLHPSSSQLTLALSKALRTFLSPKTLRSTLIWIHSTRSSFRVTCVQIQFVLLFLGLLVLEKGP